MTSSGRKTTRLTREGKLRYRIQHVPDAPAGSRLSAQVDGVVIEHGEPVLLLRVTAEVVR